MKSKIWYVLIRFAIFQVLGLFIMLVPLYHNEAVEGVFANTEQKIWIMIGAAIIATLWVGFAFYLLHRDRNETRRNAEMIIQDLQNNERWKNYQSTLAQLREKCAHLEDCKLQILQMEGVRQIIIEKLAYIAGEWQTQSVAPSFMSSEYLSWARDLRYLMEMREKINAPYALLDSLFQLEREFQEEINSVTVIMNSIRSSSVVTSPALAIEISDMQGQFENVIQLYESATTLDIRKQARKKIKEVKELAEVLSQVVKLLAGESDIIEYQQELTKNKMTAVLFRIYRAIFPKKQPEVNT